MEGLQLRHGERLHGLREEMERERRDRSVARAPLSTASTRLATRASEIGEALERLLTRALSRGRTGKNADRGVNR